MPTILGLDLGEKRIGLAMADDSLLLATPLRTVGFESRQQLLSEIQKAIREEGAIKIVVGLPKTLKGEFGPAAQKVSATVGWLKSQIPGVEWAFWDERLSTAEVERVLLEADVRREDRKGVRDKLAAQRILQNYLDAQRS